MAVVNQTYMTLADRVKADAESAPANVQLIEMLSKNSPLIGMAPVFTCNDGTTHKTKMRSTLPSVGWRRPYEGVAESKSRYGHTRDATARLEGWSTIDEWELENAEDPALVRMQEAEGYMESISQEGESAIFYASNLTDPEKPHGLAPRYNSTTTGFSDNVIDAGGTGSDNASIWAIDWGPLTCGLLVPKGSAAGIQRVDHGRQIKYDDSNNPYPVKMEEIILNLGLFVSDKRAVVRICNIDVSNLDTGSAANLYRLMIKANYQLGRRRGGKGSTKRTWVMNSTLAEYLDTQSLDHPNVRLGKGEVQGQEVNTFRGAPIIVSDALLDGEAAVS